MGHLCGSLGAAWRYHRGILGASLAQEDFEGKTSKLAKTFIKNWSGGPQNSEARTVFLRKLRMSLCFTHFA